MKRIILIIMAMATSACSGLEIGGKLGVYAVDEKQDSSRTYRRQSLKCLFVSCPVEAEAQGS